MAGPKRAAILEGKSGTSSLTHCVVHFSACRATVIFLPYFFSVAVEKYSIPYVLLKEMDCKYYRVH
jgi:hypothetical protein